MKNTRKQVKLFIDKNIDEIELYGISEGVSDDGTLYITSTNFNDGIKSDVQILSYKEEY